MPLYCGIDLHSNNSVISLINEQDQVIKDKRLANDLDSIRKIGVRYEWHKSSYNKANQYAANARQCLRC